MDGRCPELLIFDCDGVLVDSEPIASRVLAEALTEIGIPMTAQQAVDRYTGLSLPTVLALVAAELGRDLPADFAVRLGERDRAAFLAELRPVAGWWMCCAACPGPDAWPLPGASTRFAATLG
jgi:beta-phosphoglucomutase-like phosphatase (HAD superfamily)